MTEASQIKLKNTLDRIAGAILASRDLNPQPTRNIKWPCIICNRPVQNNQKALECDSCHKWCHLNCDERVTLVEYEFHENDQDNPEGNFFLVTQKTVLKSINSFSFYKEIVLNH